MKITLLFLLSIVMYGCQSNPPRKTGEVYDNWPTIETVNHYDKNNKLIGKSTYWSFPNR